jgi:hypothetical protein
VSRAQLLNDVKAATAELATARIKLNDARCFARNGMNNNLAFSESVEHTAYHRWLRASTALQTAR